MCTMAYKYREEIVGKRFLCVSTQGKLKLSKLSDWNWRSGIVRATSHKDPKHPDLSVLVEFDDTDWKGREWIRLYHDAIFHLFVVENTLVWTLRKENSLVGLHSKTNLYWPSLTFTPLVDRVGLSDNRLQPVEYLVDKELWFVDYADVLQYQEQDEDSPPANRNFAEVQKAIRQWTEYQDGQRILLTTPSVLVGYRVEVYRVEGTTQWYTAVIVSYNDTTQEITLTDDTVLEEHNEDPCLVQMRLIGEGVVESILKGETVGITPRRRACTTQNTPPAHYSTRNRTNNCKASTSTRSPYISSSRIPNFLPVASRRTRRRQTAQSQDSDDTSQRSATANPGSAKASNSSKHKSTSRRKKNVNSGKVGSSSGYRKHTVGRRKKQSRQKRASVTKGIYSTGDEEGSTKRFKASKTSTRLTLQDKNVSVKSKKRNDYTESNLSSENEAAIKVQPPEKNDSESSKKDELLSSHSRKLTFLEFASPPEPRKQRRTSSKRLSGSRTKRTQSASHGLGVPSGQQTNKKPVVLSTSENLKAHSKGKHLESQPKEPDKPSPFEKNPFTNVYLKKSSSTHTSTQSHSLSSLHDIKSDKKPVTTVFNSCEVLTTTPSLPLFPPTPFCHDRVLTADAANNGTEYSVKSAPVIHSPLTKKAKSDKKPLVLSTTDSNVIETDLAVNYHTSNGNTIASCDSVYDDYDTSQICSQIALNIRNRRANTSRNPKRNVAHNFLKENNCSVIKWNNFISRAHTENHYCVLKGGKYKKFEGDGFHARNVHTITDPKLQVANGRFGYLPIGSQSVIKSIAKYSGWCFSKHQSNQHGVLLRATQTNCSKREIVQTIVYLDDKIIDVLFRSAQQYIFLYRPNLQIEANLFLSRLPQLDANIKSRAIQQYTVPQHLNNSNRIISDCKGTETAFVEYLSVISRNSKYCKKELAENTNDCNTRYFDNRRNKTQSDRDYYNPKNCQEDHSEENDCKVYNKKAVKHNKDIEGSDTRCSSEDKKNDPNSKRRGRSGNCDDKVKTLLCSHSQCQGAPGCKCLHPELMHPVGISHSAAAAAGGCVYPRTTNQGHSSRSSTPLNQGPVHSANLVHGNPTSHPGTGPPQSPSSFGSTLSSNQGPGGSVPPSHQGPIGSSVPPTQGSSGVGTSSNQASAPSSHGHSAPNYGHSSLVSINHGPNTHIAHSSHGSGSSLPHSNHGAGPSAHLPNISTEGPTPPSSVGPDSTVPPVNIRTTSANLGSSVPHLNLGLGVRTSPANIGLDSRTPPSNLGHDSRTSPANLGPGTAIQQTNYAHGSRTLPSNLGPGTSLPPSLGPGPTIQATNRGLGTRTPPANLGSSALPSSNLGFGSRTPPANLGIDTRTQSLNLGPGSALPASNLGGIRTPPANLGPGVSTAPPNLGPGTPIPPSNIGPYSLSPHLLPSPHVTAAAGVPPHMDQNTAAAMHQQAFRHMLAQHPIMPPQFTSAPNPHVGLDLMWQQKYGTNPWVMYEELRMERERAVAQERDRDREKSRIEREQREEAERVEREKAEKDRLERERFQKEQLQRQERLEKERLERETVAREREEREREERGRAQRDAVQQHFDETFRLVMQKTQHQLQQKNVRWTPAANFQHLKSQPGGMGRNSPTLCIPQGIHNQEYDREKVREEKERISFMEARFRQEQERWLAAVQRGEQPIPHQPHPQSYAVVEGKHGNNQVKEMYALQRSPSHGTHNSVHIAKAGISPSPVGNVPSSINIPSTQHKAETNISLYGYQPFQHTYITQAQLKAREDSKMSNNMQPIIPGGNKMHNAGKYEKELHYERPPSPGCLRTGTPILQGNTKQPIKMLHQGQERSSPVYQPLVGGGAFKPYEYSNSGSAPPAHQNSRTSPTSISRIVSSQYHHSQQDQPQNLVKADHKANHDFHPSNTHQRYDARDTKHTVSTPPCPIPTSHTPPYSTSKSVSPAASSSYSYNLIQQGLVPNPLYIAASHNSSSAPASSQAPPKSMSSPHTGSPPMPQHYSARNASGSGITSGTPICRSNAMPFGGQGRSPQRFSPVGHASNQVMNPNRPCVQEAHNSSRAILSQGIMGRSPSPAHMYTSPLSAGVLSSPHHSKGSNSPRMSTTPTVAQIQAMSRLPMPQIINSMPISPPLVGFPDGQVVPLNLQGNNMGKRKTKDSTCRKRQKIEEHLLPPQLHPQTHHDNAPIRHGGTPPHLLMNPMHHQQNMGIINHNSARTECSNMHTFLGSESAASPLLIMPDLHSNASTGSPRTLNPLDFNRNAMNLTVHENSVKIDLPKFLTKSNDAEPVQTPTRPLSTISSSGISQSAIPNNSGNYESIDENRSAVSPASVTNSIVTSVSSDSINMNHTKLKKAWLQRLSEKDSTSDEPMQSDSPVKQPVETPDDTKPVTIECTSEPCSDSQDTKPIIAEQKNFSNGQEKKYLKAQIEDDSTSSASEIEEEVKHVKRKLRINRKQGSSTNKKQKATENVEDTNQPKKDNSRKKSFPLDKEIVNSKRRGRKTKGQSSPIEEVSVTKKKTSKPPEKPSIAQLKKTGEPFLQDGPCCEVAPRLPKCRECRMTAHQRSKKMPNIFCRFYAYRKLRYGKNSTISGAGFSEPSDATEDDLKLWLPPVENPPSDIEIETSKFLLTHIGDQFCDLVEMEREAQAMHISESTTVTWKRVVQGVREMCDVCETTLFNFHWVCHKCGFVVCIDCYKSRKNGTGNGEESQSKDRDQYQWLFCTNRQAHEQEKLMLTQIIANTALWDVGKTLHDVRRIWNIPTYCSCSTKDGEDGKHSTNGICKLMSAVTKCFSSEKESGQMNGVSESVRLNKKGGKSSSVNGVKQEDGMSGYSSESGGSPLSWLADVALHSSVKIKDEKGKDTPEECEEEKSTDNQQDHNESLAESDDEKNENFSTLRELLIRPMGKMGTKNSGTDNSSQKTLKSTLDEVISCVIEQRVRKSDKKCKEKQLLHFTRRHQLLRSGRELLPIRTCMLTESSLLYPEIPHIWLGNGKILLLTDPSHSGNLQMFQEQWKRGQPVIIADVGQKLDKSLWIPENFSREFGDIRNDCQNCMNSKLVPNQQMKKFWEGFINHSKRMKDEDGEFMVLKLKDWPSSEEFCEILPTRYQDLIKALPLSQYTHRNGVFNMASRLPDCFVRPDLGPRMYSAYGLSSTQQKASTNLHLDISDTVNVLAYVEETLENSEDLDADIIKSLDTSGCDSTMKKRGLEFQNQIGAIWHVYNARDADKIRDMLNKISEEKGTKCDPHHDPLHNQEWYLDEKLRSRLFKEYGVEGYTIIQCFGDAVFIPAGSPHQVRNLKSCIKVSEDFVSPESVGHSFFLTQEMCNLPDDPLNHEDKLQIKNVIYHAVKDALAMLQSNNPDDSKS